MKPFFKNQPKYQVSYKHDIGDEVYFMYMNGVRKAKVTNVIIKKSKKAIDIWCVIDKNPCGVVHTKTFREEELYRTKTELLDSL